MCRAEKPRPMSAREEIAQLARILRSAYTADEDASFNDLLEAIDNGTQSLAADRVPRDRPEDDR